MKKSIFHFLLFSMIIIISGCTVGHTNMVNKVVGPISQRITKAKIIKFKLYQNDSLAILWIDFNGDGKCDGALLYEKKNGYYIENRLECKVADDLDKYTLEPYI